jgi:hypothetical protein
MAFASQTYNNEYYISSWKHTKPISQLLQSCSITEFETILELAAESLKSLRESSSSIQFQEILNKKLLEFEKQKTLELKNLQSQIEKQKQLELTKLQNQIKDLQIQLEQSNKSYQALNQNFYNLQSSSQENFTKSLHNAVSHVETQHSKVENLYKEQIINLHKQLEEYTKNTLINSVSSNKGKTGEQNFDSLVESFTTWELKDTAKTPHSCDRFGEIRGCKTLFEIKNYSHNVPKKEVDKFKRDLEVHKDCQLGIFISLNTNIVGAPQEFFYTEFTNSNQLLLYVQQFNNHDVESLMTILNSLVDVALLLYNKSSILEKDDTIQNKVDSIKPILQMELTNIASIIKEHNSNTKFVLETVQKHHSSLKHHLEKLQFTFKTLLQTFFEDMMIIDTSSDEIKPVKKRNRRKSQNNQVILDFKSSCEIVQNPSA